MLAFLFKFKGLSKHPVADMETCQVAVELFQKFQACDNHPKRNRIVPG